MGLDAAAALETANARLEARVHVACIGLLLLLVKLRVGITFHVFAISQPCIITLPFIISVCVRFFSYETVTVS